MSGKFSKNLAGLAENLILISKPRNGSASSGHFDEPGEGLPGREGLIMKMISHRLPPSHCSAILFQA
jgi:hypothetical protein